MIIIMIGCLTLAVFIGYRLGKRKESQQYMQGFNMGIYLSSLRKESEMQRIIREVIESERGKG